jgi:hypothetical protein
MFAPSDGSASTPAQASLIEDLIDIWFSPSAVFARRREGGAWGPFLVCCVLLIALFYVAMGSMQGFFDAEMAKAIAQAQAQNPNLTAEQMAGAQSVMEASMKFGSLVMMPVVLLGLGFCVWLLAKVLGGSLSFGGGVMVASFAYMPKVLETLLIIVQGLLFDTASWTGRYQFSWGVGRFLDPAGSQLLYQVLGRVDVFTIWVTVLVALGLVHAGKVEKSKAFVGAALLWVIGAIPAVLQALNAK